MGQHYMGKVGTVNNESNLFYSVTFQTKIFWRVNIWHILEEPPWLTVSNKGCWRHHYNFFLFKGGILSFFFFTYVIQHCYICRPSDSTVYEVAGVMGSNPGLLRLWHWQPNALTIQPDIIHNMHMNKSDTVQTVVLINTCSHEY